MIVEQSEVILQLGLSTTITEEERAMVAMSLTKAEAAVRRYLKYDPALKSRTEFYPRMQYNNQRSEAVWEVSDTEAYLRTSEQASAGELQVQHLPIRRTVAPRVWIDYDGRSGTLAGSFTDEKVEGTDFWPNYDGYDSAGNQICRDGIIRSISGWPTTPNSIKITYTSGYTPEEFRGQDSLVDASPIWESILEEAVIRVRSVFIWKKRQVGGFTTGLITTERMGDYSYSIDASASSTLFSSQWDLQSGTVMKLTDFVNMGYMLAP